MDRVEIICAMVGICHMRICAVKDATDEEILEVCNRGNLAGTRDGWTSVIREEGCENQRPLQCEDHPDRQHFLVAC